MARDITPMPPPFAGMHLNPKLILAGILGLLLLIGVLTSFYQVPTESVGIVQRFGRYHETTLPGLRFKIPLGVDEVTLVQVQRQLKLEFGFATPGAADPYQSSRDYREQENEKSMVTGDLNAAQVEWVVQYGISDPKMFLFKLREPKNTLRDLSESAIREVVGDRTVDEVLTSGREEIETESIKKLQQIATKLEMGLRVEQVQLKNVHPPAPVQKSFDDVNRALQEKEQAKNVANGEKNDKIPAAKGDAEKKISEAQGYATKRINEALGDVARFSALLEQYAKAPEITRQRLYLETMAEVIPSMGPKIIIDEHAQQFLPLMQLQAPKNLNPRPAQR